MWDGGFISLLSKLGLGTLGKVIQSPLAALLSEDSAVQHHPLPSPCGQYLEVDIEAHPVVPHFDDLVTSSEQVLAILAQCQGRTAQLVHRGHLRTRNGTSSLS